MRILLACLFVVITAIGCTDVPGFKPTSAGNSGPVMRRREMMSMRALASPDLSIRWSRGRSETSGAVQLSVSPVALESIAKIVPMGYMAGQEVLPSDHAEFILQNSDSDVKVVAPADGYVVLVFYTEAVGSDERSVSQAEHYRVVIEHTGTYYTVQDNLSGLDPAVAVHVPEQAPFGVPWHMRLPIKAGQSIGILRGTPLKFSVVDSDENLSGYAVREHYLSAPWRLHLKDPLAAFSPSVSQKLTQKCIRKSMPFGGRTDFDRPHSMMGNWSLSKTDFLGGSEDGQTNWNSLLAIAPHHIEPNQLVFSIGDCGGGAKQVWISKSGKAQIERANVGEIVKVETFEPSRNVDGTPSGHANQFFGTLLLKLESASQLKVELFAGKALAAVQGFSPEAKLYTR